MSADTPVRPSHDPRAPDDGLEPPTLRAGLMAWIAVAAVVFIIVSMALLYGVYRLGLSNPGRDPAHVFPEPRLETSIDPRNMPSVPEPGPAPPILRHASVEPAADLQRAMQVVAAKGAHALDPPAKEVGDGGEGNPSR